MKLKYYLRGLGIGIVVAVLVTSVSFQNRQPMTDEEIKARAAELGMIENSVLSNIANKEDPAKETDNQQEEIVDKETDNQQDEVVDNEIDNQQSTENDSEAGDEQGEKPDETTEETTEADNKTDNTADNEADKDTISITVAGGDSSWTVSKRLEEAGLVESAKDFDTHLCRYGYDKKISVGTYKIPITATHEEIAKIITKSE